LAVSLRHAPRKGQIQNGLIAAAVIAAAAAIVPIVIAAVLGVGSARGAKTAFASAPAGDYAVVSRTQGDQDIIAVVSSVNPGDVREIARVSHIDGYAANGSVSPDGRRVALVVADGGSKANPNAALVVLDLDTGEQTRLADDVDILRTPIWSSDSSSVVVNRNAQTTDGRAAIQVLRVELGGADPVELLRVANVLGVYPVGFDAQGRLVSVVVDGRGSTLVRDGQELGLLSEQITRDWRLSPDGAQIAFIESDVSGGLAYRGRVAVVDNLGGGVAHVESQVAGGQQLGVAWKPGDAAPTFGQERETAGNAERMTAQELESSPGFDVPLAYASDGSALAVNHWTGASFADPGHATLQIVDGGQRADVQGFARFYGWARR